MQLHKEIGNTYENLELLSVKHLQDESRVRSIRKELADFGARLAAFPEGDENVGLVRGNLDSFRRLSRAEWRSLEQGQAAKGGVLTRLADGRWILSHRLELTPILAENLAR